VSKRKRKRKPTVKASQLGTFSFAAEQPDFKPKQRYCRHQRGRETGEERKDREEWEGERERTRQRRRRMERGGQRQSDVHYLEHHDAEAVDVHGGVLVAVREELRGHVPAVGCDA
jgi:hypothetical protein